MPRHSRHSAAGSADIFAGFGELTRAEGAAAEAQNYQLAAEYALQEKQYTQMSTAITQAQEARELNMSLGRTAAEKDRGPSVSRYRLMLFHGVAESIPDTP